jgi:hypothetical protein
MRAFFALLVLLAHAATVTAAPDVANAASVAIAVSTATVVARTAASKLMRSALKEVAPVSTPAAGTENQKVPEGTSVEQHFHQRSHQHIKSISVEPAMEPTMGPTMESTTTEPTTEPTFPVMVPTTDDLIVDDFIMDDLDDYNTFIPSVESTTSPVEGDDSTTVEYLVQIVKFVSSDCSGSVEVVVTYGLDFCIGLDSDESGGAAGFEYSIDSGSGLLVQSFYQDPECTTFLSSPNAATSVALGTCTDSYLGSIVTYSTITIPQQPGYQFV